MIHKTGGRYLRFAILLLYEIARGLRVGFLRFAGLILRLTSITRT